MKRKNLIYLSLVVVLGFALFSANNAFAFGGFGWFGSFRNVDPSEIAQKQQAIFEHQAQILGLSVDQIKNAWAEGKTIKELAEEQGITQEQLQKKMQNAKKEQMKFLLQILVEKGVITQDQANKRLEFIENSPMGGNGFGRTFRGLKGNCGTK